ncbi:hypothetical protein CC2G_011015 [Coprinopsis cinerea AmutBmut pab1-1]|nr:hypothetical protein CC2G_011015 [Coprinopsis cinerea AmutBmut pab1-1]
MGGTGVGRGLRLVGKLATSPSHSPPAGPLSRRKIGGRTWWESGVELGVMKVCCCSIRRNIMKTDEQSTDGWVYTNDAWLGARPAPYTAGGGSVTRRRRWTRRVWFDVELAKLEEEGNGKSAK